MGSKKKTKTITDLDKYYVLLYDTFGDGLATFSFGLEVIYSHDLEDYIVEAARELWYDTESDSDDLDDADIISVADQIVVLEVTDGVDISSVLQRNKKIEQDEERKLYERLKKKYEQQ